MRKKTEKTRVAVGMSGGVDSSVAAVLLVEQGFEVTGVHLVCFEEPGCRAPEDRKDALEVAIQLGIPFEVLDFQNQYKKRVIDYFYAEYEVGRTPNPDVMCNKEIKFGLFYKWAMKKGFDYVATGHYARVKDGKLFKGVDSRKDQTYFLYQLRQEQLRHVMFPIGNMTKIQVRRKAKKLGLVTADKPDSQGICFLGDIKPQEFLRRRISEKRGEVVDTRGNVIGTHKGVWFYTIGQREGFKLRITKGMGEKLGFEPTQLPPLYVVSKDVVRNRLIVGISKEAGRDEFELLDVHWIGKRSALSIERLGNLRVRIRHGGALIPARFKSHDSRLKINLKKPQRGVAPGQSAVFYHGEECLGGGIIQ